MSKLRVGIIGCGRIAVMHFVSIEAIDFLYQGVLHECSC